MLNTLIGRGRRDPEVLAAADGVFDDKIFRHVSLTHLHLTLRIPSSIFFLDLSHSS